MKATPRSKLLQIDLDRLVEEAAQIIIVQLEDMELTSYRLQTPIAVHDATNKLLLLKGVSIKDGSILVLDVKNMLTFDKYTVQLSNLMNAVSVAIDILQDLEQCEKETGEQI